MPVKKSTRKKSPLRKAAKIATKAVKKTASKTKTAAKKVRKSPVKAAKKIGSKVKSATSKVRKVSHTVKEISDVVGAGAETVEALASKLEKRAAGTRPAPKKR